MTIYKIPPPPTNLAFRSIFSLFLSFFSPKQTFKISWLTFIILSSLFLTCMNFKLFSYIYENLNSQGDTSLFIIFPLLYFFL